MSALASQLAGLRAQQAPAARLSNAGGITARDSYLFPARLAAEQDYETVHALAVTGWEHLVDEDAALASWAHGDLLFGDGSVRMDRATLPASTNAEIDAAVREFLYLIGPVLLSRSAAKCLEWLVRRFRVHEFVPRDVLRAFLPYHATPQFVRMLQLLPLPDELAFLAPVKKAATPLPLSVLLQAMHAHVDVLRWVATARAPPGVAERRSHTPFWTSILVQFCVARKAKRRHGADAQAVLQVLVPEVLYMADAADAEAAIGALMVLSTMGATMPLHATAVRGLLDAITRLAAAPALPGVARAMIAACLALCASPESVPDPFDPGAQRLLSDESVQHLLRLPELGALLTRALAAHDVAPCIAQVLGGVVAQTSSPAACALLETLLAADGLPRALGERACVSLLLRPTDDDAEARVRLLAQLRERHPALMDAAVQRARALDEAAAWRVMRAVLHVQSTGAMPAGAAPDTALWLGVHGADVGAQELALTHLLGAVQRKEVRADDVLVSGAVETALASGEPRLLAALYAQAPLVLEALGADALLERLEARCASGDAAPAEVALHVQLAADTLLASAPALGARVWERLLWPHLLPLAHAPSVAWALPAPALAVDVPCARAVRALTAPTSDAVGWTLALCDALVAEWRALDDAALLAEADTLCRAAASPISRGGALALMGLAALLSAPLRDAVWVPLAFRLTALLHEQQLLAGQLKDVVVGARVERAVVQSVHDALSRQSVRLLGVQLAYAMLQQIPTSLGSSLYVDVQQRATPLAQWLLLMYQTLHAPGCGAVASSTLVPVLLERLGAASLALLAGAGLAPSEAPAAPRPATLPALAAALPQRALAPPCDVPVRLMAMRHAALLARAAAAQKRALDVQTLFPGLLVVLQHRLPVLRDAAAQLLCALDEWNQATDAPRDVYGVETVYGARTAALQYLDTPTYAKYTARLAAEAGAFINDASYLAATHARLLRGSSKKETAFRTKILCYVLSHAVCVPDESVRVALLAVVSSVPAPCKLTTLRPLLEAAVEAQGSGDATYLELLFGAYDASCVPVLDDHAWALLLRALSSDASTHLPRAALHALQGGLFAALPSERRQDAFVALARTLADPAVAPVPEAREALRVLPVSDAVLVTVLRTLCASVAGDDDDDDQGAAPPAKRRGAASDDAVRSAAVVLITVLESMQSRTLGMSAALVAALFGVVRAAVSLSASPLFNAEYLLQLALQSLCSLFDHVTVLPADVAQVVRADTIVGAIKASSNTQTINHAILLLARFARLDAELVLHNIMPIFTFVGLNVLQRDDRFTLAVVEQTLRSIIPSFVSAVRPKVVNDRDARLALWHETRSLLRIFSDAATHIPRHRRHVFFRLLVDVLGADDFLAPVCMLLADRVVHRVSRTPSHSAALLELPLGLVRAEPLAVRVHALNQVWTEIDRLLARADDVFLAPAPKREYSEEHLSPVLQAHTLLLFVQHALGAASPDERAAAAGPLAQFAWHALCVVPPDAATAAALADTRAAVVRLLPVDAFLQVCLALVRGERTLAEHRGEVPASVAPATLRATGLALLAAHAPLAPHERTEQAALLGALSEALLTLWEAHDDDDALVALRALLKDATSAEHAALAALLPRLLGARTPTPAVLGVVSEILAHVGVRALMHLAALVSLAAAAVESPSSDAVLTGGLQLWASLYKTLAPFMHSHVERCVRLLMQVPPPRVAATKHALRRAQDAMLKQMPAATVLDALAASWPDAAAAPAQLALLHLLQLGVREMDKASVGTQYKRVYRFLLAAMDVERAAPPPPAGVPAALGAVPQRAIAVLVTLALRLSESQFRPLFLRTYDWAVVDLLDDAPDGIPARTQVLYALVLALLEQLHAMMVPYFGVLLKHLAEVLQQPDARAWALATTCVARGAAADEGTFWNAARAAPLVAPLVRALPRAGHDEAGDALCALAAAVPDDALLRSMHQALLKAAKASPTDGRVRVLDVCARLWEEHGLALLTFVPETVAALTELLDDADPRAAAAALRLRAEIEKALGEPLDSYLDTGL